MSDDDVPPQLDGQVGRTTQEFSYQTGQTIRENAANAPSPDVFIAHRLKKERKKNPESSTRYTAEQTHS